MDVRVTPIFSSDVPCFMLRFCPSLSLHGCELVLTLTAGPCCHSAPTHPPSPFPNLLPCRTEERSETRLPPSLSPVVLNSICFSLNGFP